MEATLARNKESPLPHIRPKSAKAKRKQRRSRIDKQFKPNFNIPGVHKVVIKIETQYEIKCIVGDTVTAENPWITIDKDLLCDNIEMHIEDSEFLPIKEEIFSFPGEEILMGYIHDESQDFDEFYICVTEEAVETVKEIIKKLKYIQDRRLRHAVNKKVKHWASWGSEADVEETWIKYNRNLLEVEIESKYPIVSHDRHLRRSLAQDRRDGYVALIPGENQFTSIYKECIDFAIQVIPPMVSHSSQTYYKYPKNSYTKCDATFNVEASRENELILERFRISPNMVNIPDMLVTNVAINPYLKDYDNLVLNTNLASQLEQTDIGDYLSFINMDLTKTKMVSSMCWHPMWTGCVVLSYTQIAPTFYLDSKRYDDRVLQAVHDTQPVLFWSLDDNIQPKLILETPRPVFAVSCCPYNENIIIGGCVNGQVIVWDITNKLEQVEEEEVLNVNQITYRRLMFSLMDWMKNIFDLTLVKPTAISDLKYSHPGCINDICWMSPFHKVTNTGKFDPIGENETHSLELMTSAEDGSVLIWDLLKKPIRIEGGFRVRTLRRLKKKPSALLQAESSFKILHLNLRPVYRLNLVEHLQNQRPLAISSFFGKYFEVIYKSPKKLSKNLQKRLFYKPFYDVDNCTVNQSFYVGTMDGEVNVISWDGKDFDSGDVVNWENARFVSRGRYHDGPIVAVKYSSVHKTLLSVGGKIFALWKEDFLDRPVFYRKGVSIYTFGSWFHFDPSTIKLTRMDGYIEMWILVYKSKQPYETLLASNGAVTSVHTHPRKLKSLISGVCDYRGLLRLCQRNYSPALGVEERNRATQQFLNFEVDRKRAFMEWQETWNKIHAPPVEEKKVEEEEKSETITVGTGSKKSSIKKSDKTAGQRYLDTVQEQHQKNTQARIRRIILSRKQLNREQMIRQCEPLRKLEDEKELKRQKQRNLIKNSDQIFNDTVAMLFPEVIAEKPSPPLNPYKVIHDKDTKRDTFTHYQLLAADAQDFIDENPFNYEFSWAKTLKNARERSKLLHLSADKIRVRRPLAKEQVSSTKQKASTYTLSSMRSTSIQTGYSRQSAAFIENILERASSAQNV